MFKTKKLLNQFLSSLIGEVQKPESSSHLSKLETPRVIVDKKVLHRNIIEMQRKADKHKLKLRPHIKTHKCAEIAQLQIKSGANGLTCAKTDEAITFLHHGFKDMLVAAPIADERKLERLLKEFKEHGADLKLVFDHPIGLEIIENVAKKFNVKQKVYLEVNVGLNRCGVNLKDSEMIGNMIARLKKSENLEFLGLLSHAGNSYSCKSKNEVIQVADKEIEILHQMKKKIYPRINFPEISIGSTPTCLVSENYDEITEIRPGNYVFLDLTCLRMGIIEPTDISLSVISTVVSVNKEYSICDAGSKILSSDKGAHGTSIDDSYGRAYPILSFFRGHEYRIPKLSEEQGWIQNEKGEDTDHTKLYFGSKLRIIPNHSCPVINLVDKVYLTELDILFDEWNVIARGKTN